MINTTVGQLLVNDALPEDLRDYNRTLDKKALNGLLQQVARQYPEQYRDISFKLNQVGKQSAQEQGGMSFGVSHLKKSEVAKKIQTRIRSQLNQILADESLTDKQRAEKIILTVGREGATQEKDVLEEARQKGNPLAMQVLSGTRGKPMNLASLLAADMLYSDHRDEVIPIPVLRSYSEGLSPEEYWAGTYGARRGIIATKFATQEAGFLSKQLNQAGHRLVVMGEDSPEEQQDNIRGLVVDTEDMDNEGALLASDVGPYKRNTPLTPKILKHISRLGTKRILVRSPIIGGSPEGGVYARDVGVRETGALPGRGEQVGLQAAQALSEPISQGQLSAKHSGGVAGKEKAVGGFQYINQLIQTPKIMLEGAAHSTKDGAVQQIEEAPAGGQYVYIDGERHYVGAGYNLKVKKGDTVEAGDLISEGIPNPAIITQYKGVGEGRRYFVNEFKKSMANSGMSGHRRNIELLARGLINHVKLTAETEDNVPDDIIPYSTLEHTYKPRENHQTLDPKKALGQYLERPVLHYTIGTKIRPSMLKDFSDFGVKNLTVHSEPPPFEPYMVRGMYQLQHDPDWMTQMYGSGLKKSLLTSVHRGAKSEERGTSFVPSLAVGTDFGEVPDRAVIQPKAPYPAPNSTISPNIMDDGLFKLSEEKQAFTAPTVAAGLGGLAGLYSGYSKDPGVDEKGRQKSRFKNMLTHGLAGTGLGYGAGKALHYGLQAKAPEITNIHQNAVDKVKGVANNNYLDYFNLDPQIKSKIPLENLQVLQQYSGKDFKFQNPEILKDLTIYKLYNLPPQHLKYIFDVAVNPPPATSNDIIKSTGRRFAIQQGENAFEDVVTKLLQNRFGAVATPAAKTRLGAVVNKVTGAPYRMLVPGATLANVGSSTPSLGKLNLAAVGGTTLWNAGKNLFDAVGLLPEELGGTGIGNVGWDQSGFNQDLAQDVADKGILKSVFDPANSMVGIALRRLFGDSSADYNNARSFTGLNLRGVDNPLKSIQYLGESIVNPYAPDSRGPGYLAPEMSGQDKIKNMTANPFE